MMTAFSHNFRLGSSMRNADRLTASIAILGCLLLSFLLLGCRYDSAHTSTRNYSHLGRPADVPKESSSFEDVVTGGELFEMHCSSCHNGRPLAERNFRATEVTFSHMRTQAYLTGEEYRKLVHYLRRWHGIGPPTEDVVESPKRFFYSQPISELRPDSQDSDTSEEQEDQDSN